MTDFVFNTDNILCNFPSCLRKNIEELCLRSQIGNKYECNNSFSLKMTNPLFQV